MNKSNVNPIVIDDSKALVIRLVSEAKENLFG